MKSQTQADIHSESPAQVMVWDPLVRVFHWSLVASFFVAFLTDDDLMSLHAWAGYLVTALVLLRILWGLVGTQYARFTDFVTWPRVGWAYLKDTLNRRAKRFLGHNPAGGLMIVAMFIGLVMTALTGIAFYGLEEHAGPMAGYFVGGAYAWLKGPMEGLHEFFANGMMLLVVVHVAGVVVESVIHRENLVRSMFNGKKFNGRKRNEK